LNRHQRKKEDRLFDILERTLAIQEQMLRIWSPPETGASTATDFRTFEDEYLLQNLKEAAKLGDEEAVAILSDATNLEVYLAQFR
jgi:hypothetical protein